MPQTRLTLILMFGIRPLLHLSNLGEVLLLVAMDGETEGAGHRHEDHLPISLSQIKFLQSSNSLQLKESHQSRVTLAREQLQVSSLLLQERLINKEGTTNHGSLELKKLGLNKITRKIHSCTVSTLTVTAQMPSLFRCLKETLLTRTLM